MKVTERYRTDNLATRLSDRLDKLAIRGQMTERYRVDNVATRLSDRLGELALPVKVT
jgi:hypothetical protein